VDYETADCWRVTREGLGRKQIDGLKEQQRHNRRQGGRLPYRREADQIRREELRVYSFGGEC